MDEAIWGLGLGTRVDLMPVDISLYTCGVRRFERDEDRNLLIVSDSFVNMAAIAIYPGDSHRAWTMAVTEGELPLRTGAGRSAPIRSG